ncbi:MAG TPA: urea ABC transporter permease subunit UrtB, partial [Alcanivorax sp.]|nr:urea ABC transporter permease subunit UrtB [Alcanivorax sp.]
MVPLLNALMNRDLVQHRDSGAILLGSKNSDGWQLLDPVSEEVQQQVGSRDARPVVINNRLRTVINNQLALRDLASPDSEQRYQAAGQLIGNADPEMLSALAAR